MLKHENEDDITITKRISLVIDSDKCIASSSAAPHASLGALLELLILYAAKDDRAREVFKGIDWYNENLKATEENLGSMYLKRIETREKESQVAHDEEIASLRIAYEVKVAFLKNKIERLADENAQMRVSIAEEQITRASD
ncbi:hypothetical protein EK21DRAFT_111078 [Setomelanomma holmii]|uniref:Uncharacterized protein n=1 Tax=Setomelanomma holmii TaxID=210430 RepID=A0A9P4HB27_9PLEO|nr:hypothetical protein EK21DRAFT_111078 [Setomelanomma holmii]